MDDRPGAFRPTSPASDPAGLPGFRPARRPTPPPLYRHAGVLVTYDVLEVDGQRYRVAALRRLRTARGTRSPVTVAMVVLSAMVLAAIGVTLSLGRHHGTPHRETYLVLLACVAVPAVVALCTRRMGRRLELWGEYRGETVLLYACPDEREFGQVTRAVQRAREAAHP